MNRGKLIGDRAKPVASDSHASCHTVVVALMFFSLFRTSPVHWYSTASLGYSLPVLCYILPLQYSLLFSLHIYKEVSVAIDNDRKILEKDFKSENYNKNDTNCTGTENVLMCSLCFLLFSFLTDNNIHRKTRYLLTTQSMYCSIEKKCNGQHSLFLPRLCARVLIFICFCWKF